MLYFAYGSNMDPVQMAARCPGATFVGIGLLADHVLCFPRHSLTRKGGVASLVPQAGQDTWGVVYRLTRADLEALDGFEDFRSDRAAELNSYNRGEVVVAIDGVLTSVTTYLAVHQETASLPNAAYLQHLYDGAQHHGLPETYRQFLLGLNPARPAPDRPD